MGPSRSEKLAWDSFSCVMSNTEPSAAPFSSNLARKKSRLEGNRETGETPAEETKRAKPLKTQDFPITLEDFC